MTETEMPEEWECFCDQAYFHQWAVRDKKGDKKFTSAIHVNTQAEAEFLVSRLNGSTDKPVKDPSEHKYDTMAYVTLPKTCHRCDEKDREIARCHERLEIDHVYDVDENRIDIPMSDRTIPDGIYCRDKTIEGQDKEIKRLRGEVARLDDLVREVLQRPKGMAANLLKALHGDYFGGVKGRGRK